MNVQEGLGEIRRRLVENKAQPETIQVVDLILQRASLPAASGASATSLLQLVRMLQRNPVANSKPAVYNDLVKVESDLETQAEEFRAIKAAEEGRPIPKTKKFYKDQKRKNA